MNIDFDISSKSEIRRAAAHALAVREHAAWTVSEALVEKWINAFEPEPENGAYRSFLNVRDVPGQGCACRVPSPFSGPKRVLELMSNLEYRALLAIERMPRLADIREQFPLLPRSETIQAAKQLGFRHSTYPRTSVAIVMTTDLVATRADEKGRRVLMPVFVKPSENMTGSSRQAIRTLEKLAIERMYWHRRDAELIVMTEECLSDNAFWNLDHLRHIWLHSRTLFDERELLHYARAFYAVYQPTFTMRELVEKCATACKCDWKTSYVMFALASRAGFVNVDLDSSRLLLRRPVRLKGRSE